MTDLVRDHYRRPEVRETILRMCRDWQGDGVRALNGDDGWYKTLPGGKVRLRGPEDYDDTTTKSRSLYITADVFEPVVFEHSEDWVEPKGRYGVSRPAQPIGTRGDLMAYTLFADIDAVADPADKTSRSKIYHAGRKEAVEAAARYLVGHLKKHGVSKAVHVAFSGQGIYVMIHHSLSRAPAGSTSDHRDSDYKAWLLAFNALLADVERRFFEDNPEHRGRVKIDKLNNQKRKVKCLLSVHKTLDFAVVPLDPAKIEIDFEAAQLPLSEDALERARVWYQDEGDDDERHALVELIRPYAKKVKGEIGARSDSESIPRSRVLLAPDEWCPFYKNLLEYGDTVGKHRALGALAAWLYQAGWPEEAAFGLWSKVAERSNVDPRIFGTSYGVINSPSCETIQSESSGYPRLGFGNLDVCRPDDGCKGCKWPGQYENGGRKFKEAEGAACGGCCEDGAGSVADRLVQMVLAKGADLWHSTDWEPYITISVNGHREHHPLKAARVKQWLSRLLYRLEGKTPRTQSITDALNVLEGMALFDGNEHQVYIRVAGKDGKIYIDTGNEAWEAIEVTSTGWSVVPDPPVRFRRPRSLQPLPLPTRGGRLEDLRRAVNAPTDEIWIMTVSWLIYAFCPKGPYPILIFEGEQGSLKSTFTRRWRSMIDPNTTPLRRPPKNEEDLMVAARNGWVTCYDNVSGISRELSDGFCVLATGGGLGKRALYTDDEESLLQAQRPLILNGIDEVATRGDLTDRAIIIVLPGIDKKARRPEAVLDAEFEKIRAGVLGAILDVLVVGLKNLPNTNLKEAPRMADFARFIIACESALPWEKGEFLKVYDQMTRGAVASMVDNDQFTTALYHLIKDRGKPCEPYQDTSGGVLNALNAKCNVDPGRRVPTGWPQTPQGAGNKIRRVAPALREVGVDVVVPSTTDRPRLYTFTYTKPIGQQKLTIDDSSGEDVVHSDIPDITGSECRNGKQHLAASPDISDISDVSFTQEMQEGREIEFESSVGGEGGVKVGVDKCRNVGNDGATVIDNDFSSDIREHDRNRNDRDGGDPVRRGGSSLADGAEMLSSAALKEIAIRHGGYLNAKSLALETGLDKGSAEFKLNLASHGYGWRKEKPEGEPMRYYPPEEEPVKGKVMA